jgi:hypothetical protein
MIKQQQAARKSEKPEARKTTTELSDDDARAAIRRCHSDRAFRARVIAKAAK